MQLGFVSSNKSNKFKDNLTSSDDNNSIDKEESNKPDYDTDKDQYKLEGKQEEEDGETTITIKSSLNSYSYGRLKIHCML